MKLVARGWGHELSLVFEMKQKTISGGIKFIEVKWIVLYS